MSPLDPPTVTLLTDFGTRDGYVATMKGVIVDLVPEVRLDDAAHDLEQGDVRGGSWALVRYWNRYPPGTVHLAVVDPGVGTARRALAVEADRRLLVAPDNGLLTRVLDAAEDWRAVEATNEAFWGSGRSQTFHGRDVFAPVAGHLARGVELGALGPGVSDPERLTEPPARPVGDGIVGEVVAVDRFGNLITNIPVAALPSPGDPGSGSGLVVVVGPAGSEKQLELSETYASVESGRLTALVNSAGRVEVAVRDGSAARRLGDGRGLPVEVRPGSISSDPASAGRQR